MSSSPEPSQLPFIVQVRALVIVNGGLLATSFIAAFFIAYVAREQTSRVARPIAQHFDALTLVNTVLFLALFAVALRASLRTYRKAARERAPTGGAFSWSARLVPLTFSLGAASGAFYGLRAATAAVSLEEALVRDLCDEVVPLASAEEKARCFAPALKCRRAPQRGTTLHDGRIACVREALGLATSP